MYAYMDWYIVCVYMLWVKVKQLCSGFDITCRLLVLALGANLFT
jgi:hypothetical protein